jgi:hypothetical protein
MQTINYIKLFQYLFVAGLGLVLGLVVAAAIYHFSTFRRFSAAFKLPDFLTGRELQIRSLADRIITGQSSALIGLFSNERTSILGFLRTEDPQLRERLYGDKANQLIFSYVDISLLDKDCTPATFWEKALTPLQDKIARLPSDVALKIAYQECQANQFKEAKLDALMGLLDKEGWRLVLLLDRFEEILPCQYLAGEGHPEFLKTVRTLAASRTPNPLVVITASSMSLMQFHKKTQHLSPTGSPFLNFMEGGITVLGGLSEIEVDKLLEQSAPVLSKEARQFIKQLAGGHPYLLQVANSELWKALPNGEQGLFERTEKQFYDRISPMLEKVVNSWSPRTCQAFLAVVQSLKTAGFENELQELVGQGLMTKVGNQWQVRAGIFLKFVKDNPQLCNQP